MNDFEERYKSKEKRSILKYKEQLKIGIFGSFAENRFKKLESLKNYLIKKGYTNTKISTDFQVENPRLPGETEVEYNRRMSEMLIDWCNVYIFIFFYEKEDEININQSASMELERVYTLYRDRFNKDKFIVLYLEEGCGDQMRSVFRGLVRREIRSSGWELEEFKEIEDIFEHASSFCLNCLKKMFEGFRESTIP